MNVTGAVLGGAGGSCVPSISPPLNRIKSRKQMREGEIWSGREGGNWRGRRPVSNGLLRSGTNLFEDPSWKEHLWINIKSFLSRKQEMVPTVYLCHIHKMSWYYMDKDLIIGLSKHCRSLKFWLFQIISEKNTYTFQTHFTQFSLLISSIECQKGVNIVPLRTRRGLTPRTLYSIKDQLKWFWNICHSNRTAFGIYSSAIPLKSASFYFLRFCIMATKRGITIT